jgi:maltose alpha-D-glucosyltransferase / alpha-amylase
MLRSFHYAAFAPLIQQKIAGEYDDLEHWAKLWTYYISKIFLNSYLQHMGPSSSLIPEDKLEISRLLSLYLLEKAVYEIGYEIDNRPDWLKIPIKGILYEIGVIHDEKKE